VTTARRVLARLVEVFKRTAIEADLDEELRLHRDLLANEYQRRGVSPAEARRQASITLGGLDQAKEMVGETRGFASFETFTRDLIYAVRSLRKSPGFASVTVLTLALGIAVNVAIFSIVDAVVLRPLPYPAAHRLVSIWETTTPLEASGPTRGSVAPGNLADYRQAGSLSAIAGLASRTRNLTGDQQPETVLAEEVTDNYFAVLGVMPAIGRTFTAADASPLSNKVVILGDGLWRRRYGANPAIIGQAVTLDDERFEVIGVMPANFRGLSDLNSSDRRSLWLPAAYPPEVLANRGDHEIRLVARLADDASVQAARTELSAISESLAAAHPETNASVRTDLQSLGDDVVRNVRTSLLVLLLTVGLILSIACVNVANLFLARGVARRREIAVRFALGATRRRVVTSLVAESLILAFVASLAGIVLAVWIQNLLLSVAPQTIPRLEGVTIDVRVLVYTGLVALVTGVLFGIIPAWQTGHSRPADALSGAGRVVAGAAVLRWRNVLMLVQVALSAVLLVGAALMVRSLLRLNSVTLGFESENVVALRMTLPERRYPSADARLRFFEQLERRVDVVGYTNNLPLRGGWGSGFTIAGMPVPPRGSFGADFQAVSPGYFPTLGIRLAHGRLITADDTKQTAPIAVVSRMFERRFLDGLSAIGRQIRRGPNAPLITIVGVIDDVRRDGRTSDLEPQVYLPAAQTTIYPVRLSDLAVRAHGNPTELVPAIRAAVWSVDSEQAISNVRTLDELLLAGSADRRFQALLFLLFAALALLLASVGTYGVVSYVVTQRTPEIGLRLALGAGVWGIYRWLLARTMAVVTLGALVGLVAARWLSQFVSPLLFEVSGGDPPSYLVAGAALVGVALSASLLAGRRAVGIDPTQALRYE
jgi:putative ABC transport system permease protein